MVERRAAMQPSRCGPPLPLQPSALAGDVSCVYDWVAFPGQIAKWKKPFAGSSHAAGIIVDKVCVEAKQPNSAVRKCVRVQLKKNNKRITCFVPKDGSMGFIDENDEVLVAGFGRSGHAVGDIPGVRFKIEKVAG